MTAVPLSRHVVFRYWYDLKSLGADKPRWICHDEPMPKTKKKRPDKNPTDPNLLARSVIEAAIGEPLTPNKPAEIVIDLHQVNHRFLKGHRLMIEVQSTWFPIIDRNPQKYVPNIFEAAESDFIKARHTIYCNSKYASYLELPVMRDWGSYWWSWLTIVGSG